MATESGSYTDDVLYRRRLIAQQLADLNKQPIQHPWQGVAQLASNFMGGVDEANLRNEQKASETKGNAALAQALGLPAPEAAPQSPRGIDRIASLLSGKGWTPPQQGGVQPPQNSQAMPPPSASPQGQAALPPPSRPWEAPQQFGQIGPRLMGDLQRDFGLPAHAAAGIVGNLGHESGGFSQMQEQAPTIPGSRGGFGYAQWTGPRRDAFEAWAKQNNLDPTSYEANYGFLKHELQNTPEGKVLDGLRSAPDVASATRVFQDQFLRPGIPATGARLNYANQAAGFQPPPAPVQTAALPPPTMNDAGPQMGAPAPSGGPQGGLPSFAQGGGPQIPFPQGGAPTPPPMTPQPPPIQPGSAPSPSPAAAPVGGAGVSSPSAPPTSPAGQRDPRQVAMALYANPATRQMGQNMIAQLLSRDPTKEALTREQLIAAQNQNAEFPTKQTAGQLDVEGKRLGNEKARRDLLPEGSRPLTPEERKHFGLTDDQAAYFDTKTGKPVAIGAARNNVTVNNAINPILKGMGEQFVAGAESARASVDTIRTIHNARKEIDSDGGIFSGAAAGGKLNLAKVGSLFGITDADTIARTESFRAAIGESVLARAKSLGANPSNTDRDYIKGVMAGEISLDEKSIRRILDIQEKSARTAIERHNSLADKMLETQPELKQVAPMLRIEPPSEYQKPAGSNAPVKVTSPDEARKLPKGTRIILPDGSAGVVP